VSDGLDVVVVSYRSRALLRRCLASLVAHPPARPMRVIVVDNDSRDGTVELVDPKTLRTLRRVPGVPHGAVSGLAFAPGSGLLAVAGGKGYLALIDHRDGSVVRPLAGHRDRRVLAPSFSTDGRRMLTVSLFDTVQLWTLRAGRPVGAPRRFPTPPGVVIVPAILNPEAGMMTSASFGLRTG